MYLEKWKRSFRNYIFPVWQAKIWHHSLTEYPQCALIQTGFSYRLSLSYAIFFKNTRKPNYNSFFSVLCPHFKNVFFGRIPWAPFEVVEVKWPFLRSRRPNLRFHLVYIKFPFTLPFVFGFNEIWTLIGFQPWRPQKGLRELYQKLHFWNQCVPTKKMMSVCP